MELFLSCERCVPAWGYDHRIRKSAWSLTRMSVQQTIKENYS
jgi:hypothetical protein